MLKNRFDILKVSTDNENKKPRQIQNTESKQNIFKTKQKQKPSQNQNSLDIKTPNNIFKKQQDSKISANSPDIKSPNNIFKKQQDSKISPNSPDIKSPNNIFKKQQKFDEFNIKSIDFPELEKDNPELEKDKPELEKDKPELEKDNNYLEKINKKEINKKETQLVPPGWTLLRYKDIIYKRHLHIKNNNNTIDLWKKRLIMANRLRAREELNDILGDISPYWNTNLYSDDDDENDDDNDSAYEEEEDYETTEYYDD